MKHCPYCAEEIQDAAIVCRYCGRDLRVPVPFTGPDPTQAATKDSRGVRFDWQSGAALVVSIFVSLAIYKVIMDRFLAQPINVFDSIEELVFAFYNTTLVALGVGFAIGGFLAGNLASVGRSRWIGIVLGGIYAGRLIGQYLVNNVNVPVSQEMLMVGLVILAASSVGGFVGSLLRGGEWLILALIVGGMVTALVMINGRIISPPNGRNSPAIEQSLPLTPNPTATPIKNRFGSTNVEPCVGIMSRDARFVADGFQVTGTLKNLCDLPIGQIRLLLTVRDYSREIENSAYGVSDSVVLLPGQVSTYAVKVKMPAQTQEIGYRLVVDHAEWAK